MKEEPPAFRHGEDVSSFSDIVKRVNGLGDKRMLSILDACNHLV